MAKPTWGVMAAMVVCGIFADWSNIGAATTVVSFVIHEPTGVAGVRTDNVGDGTYEDFRINPSNPANWCVDATPYSQGLLFVRLNRKLDGDAGSLRCSDHLDGDGNLGVPRNVRLTILNDQACDLLADPLAGLPVTDSASLPWNNTSSSGPCTVASNDNPRIRLDTLYKAKGKTTPIAFQTEMLNSLLYPVSYVIESDAAASITSLAPNVKLVKYASTYHLVRFAPGQKPKTMLPAFTMPVEMTFVTSIAP